MAGSAGSVVESRLVPYRIRRGLRSIAPSLSIFSGLLALALLLPWLADPGVAAAAAAADRSRLPDLTTAAVAVSGRTVAEGSRLGVTHRVRNVGRARADATTTRFYLTRDTASSLAARRASRTNPRSATEDLLLQGAARVKSVRPGKTVAVARAEVTVPLGTPAARYTLLACADDRGVVRESDEADNCTAAGTLTVTPVAGDEDLRIQWYGDSRRWPTDEQAALSMIKAFCQATQPPRPMGLAAARRSIAQLLTDQAGATALERLRESGLVDTAVDAQRVTAVAVSQGSPGLALAAMLEAQRLEPRNAGHLVNLAGLAVAVGRPDEALAFLDATASRDLRTPAMGIPQAAIGNVARGQAQLLHGRLAEAERSFRSALATSPLLSEAAAGLANVAACRGDDATATRFLRLSRQRNQTRVPPGTEPVPPQPSLDLDHGLPTPLRQLPLAGSPRDGVVMHPVYDAIAADFRGEIEAQLAEEDRLRQHLRDTDEARTRAERERRDSVLAATYQVDNDPQVRVQSERIRELQLDLTELRERFWGGGTGEVPSVYRQLSEDAHDACVGAEDYSQCYDQEMNRTCRPALRTAHAEWRGLMRDLQQASNEKMRLGSTLHSALASNLIDEEAHRYALIGIEGDERGLYGGLVQQGQLWTHYQVLFEDHCVEPADAQPVDDEDPATAASRGNCPDTLKRIDLVLELGPTKLKANCERIQQEISVDVVPFLGVFAEVRYHFRTGNFTIAAGIHGGGKIPKVGTAKIKNGAYVTVNGQGELVDAGWRVGPKVTAGTGPVEFVVLNDERDISLITGPVGTR